jgi:hypothetical protein
MRRVLPVIGEGLLLSGVKLERVVLGIEPDDTETSRPLRCGRWRIQRHAQLAEHAHWVVAERLKQSAARCVGLEDPALDSACAATPRMPLEPRRNQLPDPAPTVGRVDVPPASQTSPRSRSAP